MTSRKLENYYLWCLKTLIYLIPFLPLYVSSSMVFPYITGKNFAFRVIVELAAALWLSLLVINRKYRLQSSPITLSILSFTFIAGLADVFGINPYNSFWSNYGRMEGYITILHLALYFMLVKSILTSKKDWMILLNAFLIASVIASLYALITPPKADIYMRFVEEQGIRVSGTLGNPPFLASYLLLSIFMGLILLFKTQKPLIRFIYLSSVLLHSVVIYLTATRGAILTLLLVTIFFCLLFIFKRTTSTNERRLKKIVISALIMIIISTLILLSFSNSNFIKSDLTLSRFHNLTSDDSVKDRLKAWKIAWEGIKARPLLGWGQENFIGIYTVIPVPLSDNLKFNRAHNIILDWLVNAGFIGLLSYLMIFIISIGITRKAIRGKNITQTEALVIITAFAAYFIQNLFIFDTINSYLLFFTLLAYIDNLIPPTPTLIKGGMVDYQSERTLYSEVNIESKKLVIKSISAILTALLVFSVVAYYVNYKPLRQSQLSYQITISSLKGYNSFSNLLNDFKNALSLKTFGDSDIRQKMGQISSQILRHELFSQKDASRFIQLSLEEIGKMTAANVHNLKYWKNLINLSNMINVYDPSFQARTEMLIRKCMRLYPEYQWLTLALAENYLINEANNKAFITLKKADDLNPGNIQVQFKLVEAGILTSREDVVNNALENIRRIRLSNDIDIASSNKPAVKIRELLKFVEASLKVNNFNQALRFYKEIIAISPNNARYHFDIAEVYLKLNDGENAIREAKKAAELDPLNFTDNAEKIVNSTR